MYCICLLIVTFQINSTAMQYYQPHVSCTKTIFFMSTLRPHYFIDLTMLWYLANLDMKKSEAIKQEVEDLIELFNDRLPWTTPIISVGVMFLHADHIMLILCRICGHWIFSGAAFEGQQYKSKIYKRC